MARLPLGPILSALLLLAAGRPAVAEVLILTGGGRVEGEWLNRDEPLRKTLLIKLSAGARITLDRSQVKEIRRPRPEELEYDRIRPSYPDTVEGQWALAEWCHENRLRARRNTHLKRVIELDPDHVASRRALGYSQIDGKWQTQEEVMIARGYRRYKGRWRTSQEIELLEKRRKAELAEKQWAQKLNRLRDLLETDKALAAREEILAIKDPDAVAALTRNLQNDPAQAARVLYVEALANIGTPEAIKVLAICSIEDPVEEVRLTCLDYLKKKKRPSVIAYYVGRLRDRDNRVVNRAAVALGLMKDPSAIGPLIDALVTVHKYKVSRGNPGAMSATFGKGPGGTGAPGGSGLSMGGGQKIVSIPRRNQPVLDALVALTGQNFSFEERTWKYWYASQKQRVELDARRD